MSPRCNPSHPCNCLMVDDGVYGITDSGGDQFLAGGDRIGRRNTVVRGTGTTLDPYTVSFIDALAYRPDAIELRADGPHATDAEIADFDTVFYSSPRPRAGAFWSIAFPDDINITGARWVLMGLNVTLTGGAATAEASMQVLWSPGDSFLQSGVMGAHGNGADITLNAMTYIPGINAFGFGSSGLAGFVQIDLEHSHTLTAAKFWMCTI